MRKIHCFALIILCFFNTAWAGGGEHVPLQQVQNHLSDKASLQRGAQIYMSYCIGCHSLQYTRYNQLGRYLGIVDQDGQVLEKLVQSNLNFVTDNVFDYVKNSMPAKDGAKWFGVAPPDLTLVTRTRGKNWVYTYLKSFYVDKNRPWGVNNTVFPDVAMPHILLDLQGAQEAIFKTIQVVDESGAKADKKIVEGFKITRKGELDSPAYDKAITDLVNFLEYVGEPVKEKRTRLGVFVLLFLVVLTVFLYALKREYWKEVH